MRHYLAVDGGNSKTDAVIGTEDGRLLAYVRGPGTCHQNIGLPETMARLESLITRARAEADLPPHATLARADFFLAGADLAIEVEQLTAAIGARHWAGELSLGNDTLALLCAGTDAPDAIAVVCGAGINCVGRSRRGHTAGFSSLGLLSGDWGGGGHLGQLALWHAVRSADGRGPTTALARAVAEHWGLASAEELGVQIHLGRLDWDRLAELTPLLFAVADGGDPVALSLVARQAEEIVTLAAVIARRLELLDEPVAVVLGGGVLQARHPLLIDPVVAGVHAVAPKATVSIVDAPPVLGAALQSLDALGAAAGARAGLRAALTAPDRQPATRPPITRPRPSPVG
jgi:N-acetylglucosamine kinase-like BadF-type ATPase